MNLADTSGGHDPGADITRLLDEGYEVTFSALPGLPGYTAALTGPLGSTARGAGKTPAAAVRSVWPLDDDGQADADGADLLDGPEPACETCGAPVGIFDSGAGQWQHFRIEAHRVETFDAGHAPKVADSPADDPVMITGYRITYAQDPGWGSWWADLRDEQGRVRESGLGATRDAARAHLAERIARDPLQGIDGPHVHITITGDCGHVLGTYDDTIAEKYPFWCEQCGEAKRMVKYPWIITTEIVPADGAAGMPGARGHDDGNGGTL